MYVCMYHAPGAPEATHATKNMFLEFDTDFTPEASPSPPGAQHFSQNGPHSAEHNVNNDLLMGNMQDEDWHARAWRQQEQHLFTIQRGLVASMAAHLSPQVGSICQLSYAVHVYSSMCV